MGSTFLPLLVSYLCFPPFLHLWVPLDGALLILDTNPSMIPNGGHLCVGEGGVAFLGPHSSAFLSFLFSWCKPIMYPHWGETMGGWRRVTQSPLWVHCSLSSACTNDFGPLPYMWGSRKESPPPSSWFFYIFKNLIFKNFIIFNFFLLIIFFKTYFLAFLFKKKCFLRVFVFVFVLNFGRSMIFVMFYFIFFPLIFIVLFSFFLQ